MAKLSVCIQNLGKYNEGELLFKWLDLPATDEEIASAMDEIQVSHDDVTYTDEFGQPYEEMMIADYECDIEGITVGEWDSLEDLNELAEKIEGLDDWDLKVFESANEVFGDIDIDDFDPNDYMLLSGVDNEYDLGEYYINEFGGVEELSQSTIENYFDYEALGRDLDFDSYETEDDEGNTVWVTAGEYFCGDEDASDYEIGETFVDEVGLDGVGNADGYFDFERYGRDISFEADGGFSSNGWIERI